MNLCNLHSEIVELILAILTGPDIARCREVYLVVLLAPVEISYHPVFTSAHSPTNSGRISYSPISFKNLDVRLHTFDGVEGGHSMQILCDYSSTFGNLGHVLGDMVLVAPLRFSQTRPRHFDSDLDLGLLDHLSRAGL
jgi:hypothetical protein